MVHAVQINKTTRLCILTEEEWRKATSENNRLRYSKRILARTEETKDEPKYLREKGYVKHFQQERMELGNVLILYYDTPNTDRVRKLRMRVSPRQVQTSGDVIMTFIFNIMKHPSSDNIIKNTGMVLVANG